MIKIILTLKQGKYLLEHIPEGHKIKVSLTDLDKVLGKDRKIKAINAERGLFYIMPLSATHD